MNRLGFAWARWRRDEAALAAMGLPLASLVAELEGRSVALVGNARSLAEGRAGAEIDGADVVIRLNAAPMPAAASHGTRTDWLAVAVAVDAGTLAARAPRRLPWMPTSLGRLPWRMACHPGFALREAERNARLRGLLGAPATTGLLVVDLLAGSALARATLHGFDFFTSLSLSGRRGAGDVPHDFAAEEAFVRALLARDSRFELRPPPGPAASAGAS